MLRQVHIAVRANFVEVSIVRSDRKPAASTERLTPSQAARRVGQLARELEDAAKQCARELAGAPAAGDGFARDD